MFFWYLIHWPNATQLKESNIGASNLINLQAKLEHWVNLRIHKVNGNNK